jgi:hypothetical protein
MGNKMEKVNWPKGNMVMGECENWQRKSYIAQKKCKHSKGGYGIWHVPKSLVSSKLGLSHSNCGNMGDSGHAPNFQHKKG